MTALFSNHKLFGLHGLAVHLQVAEIDAFGEIVDRKGCLTLQAGQFLALHFLAEQVVYGHRSLASFCKLVVKTHHR